MQFLLGRIDYERSRLPYDPERLGLERMHELLDRLGHPERGLPLVHVAGTKGKGSTSAMIAAVLSAAGLRTGLFTSPHLTGVEERMRMDGQPCRPDELIDLIRRVRPAVETMDRQAAPSGGPTYFEITTAMALLHFARHNAAAAVLEVGLGGRLDATNVCLPAVSVITSIGLDHTEQLGTTLAAIAGEKAGIIKPGVPVVSGVVPSEPRDVIRAVCHRQGCRCIELGTDFDFDYEPPRHLEQTAAAGHFRFRTAGGDSRDFALALPGRHQAANAAVALAAVEELRRAGWNLPEAAIERALAGLSWPARVEVVARRPAVVVDGAHNMPSVEALVATLDESFAADRRWLIFAGSQDKDLRGMLARLLPKFDEVLLTRYHNNPRGAPPDELARLAAEVDGRSRPLFDRSGDAWHFARRQAAPDDLIVIAGSFFLAAELRPLCGGR